MYKGIHDKIIEGEKDARSMGMRIILLGSFVGSPDICSTTFFDALQICDKMSFHLYLSLSHANHKKELKTTCLRAEDRPDLICRVFKMKLDLMLKDFRKGDICERIQGRKNH